MWGWEHFPRDSVAESVRSVVVFLVGSMVASRALGLALGAGWVSRGGEAHFPARLRLCAAGRPTREGPGAGPRGGTGLQLSRPGVGEAGWGTLSPVPLKLQNLSK